jgi:hypothetical protein
LLPPCVVFDPSLVASDGSPLEPKPLTERATKLIQMLKSPVYDHAAGTLAIVSSDGRIARVHKDRLRYTLSVFLDMLDATDGERAAATREETAAGLPVVRLSEQAEDSGLLLKYMLDARPSNARPKIGSLCRYALTFRQLAPQVILSRTS